MVRTRSGKLNARETTTNVGKQERDSDEEDAYFSPIELSEGEQEVAENISDEEMVSLSKKRKKERGSKSKKKLKDEDLGLKEEYEIGPSFFSSEFKYVICKAPQPDMIRPSITMLGFQLESLSW
jgi:hypothetical protein